MIQRRVIVFLLTVLLAVPALSGTAQTPTAGGAAQIDQLPGIQSAVWRDYGHADTFVGSATAIANATPIPADQVNEGRLSTVSVIVYELDTTENAAAAFDQLSAHVEESFSGAFQGGTQEITTEPLPGVGTQATLARMDFASEISRVWLEYVTVQRDRYVFVVRSDAFAFIHTPGSDPADPTLPTVPLATAIAADGQPSPDEPTFTADGTSTGGLWGFMPASDDRLLMGLAPLSDFVTYPMPTG